jgi:outer membrane protein OmpA-like peptidoglycan-associated protein
MRQDDNSHWIPIADMMAGLMAIFLFISVAFMSKTQEKTKGYLDLKGDMFKELQNEFKSDLENWNAEIDEDSLTIRFKSLDTLFDTGKSVPKPEFKKVISEFFPRYSRLLYNAKFRDKIEEVRIEGHTSSQGINKDQPLKERYSLNLELSQERSKNVLLIALSEVSADEQLSNWLRTNLTANGLSFSKAIIDKDGIENFEKSKRVEFRVRLKADQVLQDIQKHEI